MRSRRSHQARQGLYLALLVLVGAWLIFNIWGLADKALVAVSHAGELKAEYELIESRRALLEASVSALQTDRGKDAAIRTAFGVARPGEEVIVVVPTATSSPKPEPGWWEKFVWW